MRVNLLKSMVFLFVIGLLVTSCGKENTPPPQAQDCTTEGSFNFKLNGILWEGVSFNNTFIYAQDPSTGLSGRRVDIRASNAAGDVMILTLTNPNESDLSCIDTGSYSLGNFFFTYGSTSLSFSAAMGNLTLTSCDSDTKELSGTFNFEDVFNENAGTEGEFTICIPQ